MTQAQIAERVGLTRASIANIETGRQKVLLHHIYLLADALQLQSVGDLLPRVSAKEMRPDDFEAGTLPIDDSLTPDQRTQLENVVWRALAGSERS